MQCPVCNKTMIEKDFGGVKVDICKDGCRGIWFDWFELTKLDEKHEGFGDALDEALKHPRKHDDDRGKIDCPKCGISMHIHQYQSSKEIEVDECYGCGGFFLDCGELGVARKTFMSEEEEKEYLDYLLADIPEYKASQENLEKNKVRNEALRKYTRFLRLSYYVTGR